MSGDDTEEKTEDPSSKKLNQAKEQGDVFTSKETQNWFAIMGIAAMVGLLLPFIMGWIRDYMRAFLAKPHAIDLTSASDVRLVAGDIIWELIAIMAVPFSLFAIIGIAASVVQHGWVWAPAKVKPNLGKVNPVQTIKQKFSGNMAMEVPKTLFKLILVPATVLFVVWPHMDILVNLPGLDIKKMLNEVHWVIILVLLAVIAVMTVLAIIDIFFEYHRYIERQRMSKTEVKEENKQTEGDPEVKKRIAELRQQRTRERMMAQVPESDVVVTNPTHYAVALKYDMETMAAPIVTAKGQDLVAWRIRQAAEDNDVPIVENPHLARALHDSVELNEEIPVEHYQAVAEVIGYVMRLRGETQEAARRAGRET